MEKAEVINQQELTDVLSILRASGTECTMSYLTKGRWYVGKIRICEINRLALQVELLSDFDEDLQIDIDQPVGIVFYYELNKYMFETSVLGFESRVGDDRGGRLIVNFPDGCERVHRRVYERVEVPESLHIGVLFWHRGYTDGHSGVPLENYWQGRLVDLSAGGLLMAVEDRYVADFRDGQLVGLQFTPLPREKPLLVEGQVKYISSSDDGRVNIGVEFVGLEASSEGRDKVGRIAEALLVFIANPLGVQYR